MHEVIASIPEYAELAQQRAQLQQRAAEQRRRSIAANEEHQRKVREHAAARRQALVAGEEPPPEPTRPVMPPVDEAAFIAETQRIDAAMAAVLAERIGSIEAQAADRETQLMAEAAKPARLLGSIGAELQELSGALRAARTAAGRREPVRSGTLDAAGVARLIAEGGSVLGPEQAAGTTFSAAIPDPPERQKHDYQDTLRSDEYRPRRQRGGRSGFHRR